MELGMPSSVGIGVIGLGLISPAHLSGFKKAEGSRLVAVCDKDRQKLDKVQSAYGVRGTTDHRELLRDPEIDAVALLLPHQLHYAIAKEALEAGKHVLVEKPFTIRESEAEDLINLAKRKGLTVALAENTRFVRAYRAAEKMVVRDKLLGDIRMVRGFIPDQIIDEWLEEPDGWKRQPNGAAVITDCAPHMLYLLIWFFGKFQSLQAISQRFVLDTELETHGIIAGKLANGALFSIEVSSVTEVPRGERVEIYGSKGTLIIDQVLDPPAVFYRGAKDSKGTPVEGVTYDLHDWKRRSIEHGAADFVAALRAGRHPSISQDDARYCVRMLERAYQSISCGGQRVDA
jgi:predicted dehydrogenase